MMLAKSLVLGLPPEGGKYGNAKVVVEAITGTNAKMGLVPT